MDSPSLSDTGLILVLLLSAVRGKKVRNIPKRVVKVVQTFANPVNAEQRRKWKQKITSTLTHIRAREYIAPICDGRGFPMVILQKQNSGWLMRVRDLLDCSTAALVPTYIIDDPHWGYRSGTFITLDDWQTTLDFVKNLKQRPSYPDRFKISKQSDGFELILKLYKSSNAQLIEMCIQNRIDLPAFCIQDRSEFIRLLMEKW